MRRAPQQVHEGGWDLRGDANQALLFLDPDGKAVDPGTVPTDGGRRIKGACSAWVEPR